MKLSLFVITLALAKGSITNITPKDSIQDAVDKAQPGDTIVLGDGTYDQDFKSARDGEPDKRITITGSRKAIVNGNKDSRMIEINHSHITLDGFTADGKKNGGKKSEDYVDKCVYIIGQTKPSVVRANGAEYESSLDGMVVSDMHIVDCGGECLRLRSFITNAEVVGNKIEGCGRHDFMFPSSTVNGEAIYVGTSSNQWDDGKNSRSGPDLTKYVWIHENEIDSQGNECVDVKEGTTDVLVEYNVCTDQRDGNSAGLDSRTDDIIFRYNEVIGCDGAGVRIGGHTIDGKVYGLNNEVYGNMFSDTKYSSVKLETGDAHTLCENECKGGCVTMGSSGKGVDIEGTCDKTRDITWITPGKVVEKTSEKEVTLEVEEDSKESNESKDSEDRRTLVSEKGKCVPIGIRETNSSSQDGNAPHNAVDGKAVTRWSAKGKGSWIEVELEEQAVVTAVEMGFYKGDKRSQLFDIYADGSPLLMGMESSGKSSAIESFPLKTPKKAKTITIFGQGNSVNEWNSITELIVCGEKASADHDLPEEEECDTFELNMVKIEASGDDGNKVSNLMGKDLKTRWSCKKSPCEVTVTLGEPSYVAELEFAVHQGKKRIQKYDVAVKTASGWQDVILDGESQKTNGVQSADIDMDAVSEIKFIGYGNDINAWNSLVSMGVVGC